METFLRKAQRLAENDFNSKYPINSRTIPTSFMGCTTIIITIHLPWISHDQLEVRQSKTKMTSFYEQCRDS